PTIAHTYTRTGNFKVVLTTTNGACTVKDSIYVPVLLKQKPVFSLSKSEPCLDQSFNFQVTGLEDNPHPSGVYANEYQSVKWEYSDGTAFDGDFYNYLHSTPNTSGNVSSYQVKDDQVRVIIQSPGFYCQDTSNYVPL